MVETKTCRFAGDPKIYNSYFKKVTESKSTHASTRISASKCELVCAKLTLIPLPAKILAVGDLWEHNKAELLDTKQNIWKQVDDYPFGKGFQSYKLYSNFTQKIKIVLKL